MDRNEAEITDFSGRQVHILISDENQVRTTYGTVTVVPTRTTEQPITRVEESLGDDNIEADRQNQETQRDVPNLEFHVSGLIGSEQIDLILDYHAVNAIIVPKNMPKLLLAKNPWNIIPTIYSDLRNHIQEQTLEEVISINSFASLLNIKRAERSYNNIIKKFKQWFKPDNFSAIVPRVYLFILESVKNILQYGLQRIFDREFQQVTTLIAPNILNYPEIGSQLFFDRANETNCNSYYGTITLPMPQVSARNLNNDVLQNLNRARTESTVESLNPNNATYPEDIYPSEEIRTTTNPTIAANLQAHSLIDDIPMESFSLCSIPTLISIPNNSVDLYGEVFTKMTDSIFTALENQPENTTSISADRAFKIYFGFPQIFFRNTTSGKLSIKEAVRKRLQLYLNNDLDTLLSDWMKDKKKWEEKQAKRTQRKKNTNINREQLQKEKKALDYIYKGFVSKGLRILEGNGVAPNDCDEVIQQMIDKHPQQFNNLPSIDKDIDCNIIDMDNIITFIKRPDLYKGVGPRSLRPDYLGKLANGRFSNPASLKSIENLKKLGKYYLSGLIPDYYRSTMNAGLLTPLKKNSKNNDSRPTNAEDFDCRVFCQTLAKNVTETVKGITTPQQLAVGVSGGVQVYTGGTYIKIEEAIRNNNNELGVLSIDIWNAHNAFNRKELDDLITEMIQEYQDTASIRNDLLILNTALRSTLGVKSNIYMRSNTIGGFQKICESCQGGRQGNPLTNLAFPLLIDKALKDIEDKFPSVEVKAYQDNITLIGPIKNIFKIKEAPADDSVDMFNKENALDRLINNLSKLGAEVNPLKSQLFTLAGDDTIQKYVPSDCKIPFLIDEDGNKHFGFENCGAPIGSEEFRKIWLEEKANEICNTIETVTTTLDKHDAHAAFNALHLSLQSRSDFILQLLPEIETKSLQEKVEESLLQAYALVAGSNFKDDSLEESEFSLLRLGLRTSLGGGGYRRMKEKFLFANNLNNILPQMVDKKDINGNTVTKGLWNSLKSILGEESFIDQNNSIRWRAFYNSDLPMAKALRDEWRQIQKLANNLKTLTETPASVNDITSAEVEAFGHGVTKLSHTIRNYLQNLQAKNLTKVAESLAKSDSRRISFLASKDDSIANSLLSSTPNFAIRLNSSEFREAFSNHFGLASPACKTFVGTHIPNNEKSKQLLVDKTGYNIKTVTGLRGDNIRIMHDNIHQFLCDELSSAKIQKKGSPGKPCKNIFAHLINNTSSEEISRHIQGIIPDIVINATSIQGSIPTIFDNVITITDIKTLAPGTAYNTISNIITNQAVNHRADQVHKDYVTQARLIDRRINLTAETMTGPVERELSNYGCQGKVVGLVFGAFGECSSSVHDLINLISRQRAIQLTDELTTPLDETFSRIRFMVKKKLSLFVAREWARVSIERLSLVANHKYLAAGEDLIFQTLRRNSTFTSISRPSNL
jgi:hypothetical protein